MRDPVRAAATCSAKVTAANDAVPSAQSSLFRQRRRRADCIDREATMSPWRGGRLLLAGKALLHDVDLVRVGPMSMANGIGCRENFNVKGK